MPAETVAVSCQSVVQVYESGAGAVHALRGVSLEVRAGAVTAIVGPSGAGKSTLLRLLACLERPSVGEVHVAGIATAALRGRARRRLIARHIGYVFQSPADNLYDYMTVAEHVGLALRMRNGRRTIGVDELLDAAGLGHAATRRSSALSVGEQQLLSFAMAIAGSPALVVADEPTASLDSEGSQSIVGLLAHAAAEGTTVVMATHDEVALRAADDILLIRDGTLAQHASRGGELLTVVDEAGRIQLPVEALPVFRSGRVRVTLDGDQARVDPA